MLTLGQHQQYYSQMLATAKAMTEEEALSSSQQRSQIMVRYLKVDMKGSERNVNGLSCTLNRIKVFGSSMH